jgi:hypothetical protein
MSHCRELQFGTEFSTAARCCLNDAIFHTSTARQLYIRAMTWAQCLINGILGMWLWGVSGRSSEKTTWHPSSLYLDASSRVFEPLGWVL